MVYIRHAWNAAEKLFDRIPEFINPVVYINDKACQLSICLYVQINIGYGTMCRKFDSIAFMW